MIVFTPLGVFWNNKYPTPIPIPDALPLMGSQLKEAGESHPSGMVIDFNKTKLEPEREKVS